jgi:DNA primase
MEISEKLKIVESFLGDYHKTGNEYLYFCPFCKHHKRKMSLNFAKGKYKCWVCDVSGNIRKLVRKKANYENFQKWKLLDGEVDLNTNLDDLFAETVEMGEEILSIPEKFVSLTNNEELISRKKALNYLKKREIDQQDILYWKIGFCFDGEYKDRIVIPSFNINGDLNYFIGRSITGSKFNKYKLPQASKDIIFNELNIDFDHDIILVEGIFDAIKAGQNSVPLLGSTLREENKLFQKIVNYDTAVYMALDPDATKKENEIIRKLINYGVETYKIDILPYKDAGEMSKQEFQKRKQNAKLMTYETLLQQELEVA